MKNPHCLVVGGTHGIGRALVKLWTGQGYAVSVIGHWPAPAADRRLYGMAYWVTDITNPRKLKSTLKEIIHRRGRIRYLVFFQRFRGEGDTWDGEVRVTLTATQRMIDWLAGNSSGRVTRALLCSIQWPITSWPVSRPSDTTWQKPG